MKSPVSEMERTSKGPRNRLASLTLGGEEVSLEPTSEEEADEGETGSGGISSCGVRTSSDVMLNESEGNASVAVFFAIVALVATERLFG